MTELQELTAFVLQQKSIWVDAEFYSFGYEISVLSPRQGEFVASFSTDVDTIVEFLEVARLLGIKIS